MKVEILTRYKSLGVHELNELPTREREPIILADGVHTFVGIGRNCITGMTELYVCDRYYYALRDELHVADGIQRVSPTAQVSNRWLYQHPITAAYENFKSTKGNNVTLLQLFSHEQAWTKGAFARNNKGESVPVHDHAAMSWCFTGAILACYQDDVKRRNVLAFVRSILPESIGIWNERATFQRVRELAATVTEAF